MAEAGDVGVWNSGTLSQGSRTLGVTVSGTQGASPSSPTVVAIDQPVYTQ